MSKAVSFVRSTVGRKVLMSASGVILVGFTLVHMLANLQIFIGAEAIDAYGRSLRAVPLLLWGTRVVLTLAVLVHVVTAMQLQALKSAARPVKYKVWRPVKSGIGARSMVITGVLLAVFILIHLANLTWGNVHPDFRHGEIFHNMVTLFRTIPGSTFYVLSMVMLAGHLSHGAWSMWQSTGVNGPRYTGTFRKVGAAITGLVVVGNIVIVVAVLTGGVG